MATLTYNIGVQMAGGFQINVGVDAPTSITFKNALPADQPAKNAQIEVFVARRTGA